MRVISSNVNKLAASTARRVQVCRDTSLVLVHLKSKVEINAIGPYKIKINNGILFDHLCGIERICLLLIINMYSTIQVHHHHHHLHPHSFFY